MSMRFLISVLSVVMLGSWLASTVTAEEFKYTGARDCNRCHSKELMGNQEATWKKGLHAKAFETLKGDKALEIAQKLGMTEPPHESGDCLKCHATSFGLTKDQFEKKPLRAREGVQCESCHGPGSEYRPDEIMADYDKSVAAGMWEPQKDEKICTVCHNDESPTFEGFDYEKAKEEIKHPIPEHVKGRYLELEAAEEAKNKPRRRRE